MSLHQSLETLVNAPTADLDAAINGLTTAQLEMLVGTLAAARYSVTHVEDLAARELSNREWTTVETFAPEYEALLNAGVRA